MPHVVYLSWCRNLETSQACTHHLACSSWPPCVPLSYCMPHLTMPLSPHILCHHAPTPHSPSWCTTNGSWNPSADAVNNIKDVVDHGTHSVHAKWLPTLSRPPWWSVLIACLCSQSRFVRTAAATCCIRAAHLCVCTGAWVLQWQERCQVCPCIHVCHVFQK